MKGQRIRLEVKSNEERKEFLLEWERGDKMLEYSGSAIYDNKLDIMRKTEYNTHICKKVDA
jgi:hypothetical protein